MGKREAQAAKDERLEQDWKQSLESIRAGLPLEPRDPPIPRRLKREEREKLVKDAQQLHLRDYQRQLLYALCARQEWKCFWCGMDMTDDDRNARSYRTLEHVVARASGLRIVSHMSNLRAACRHCNEMRGELTSMKAVVGQMQLAKSLLEGAQRTIARHKVTMAGRCLYCRWRFHFKEWLYKRKRGRAV